MNIKICMPHHHCILMYALVGHKYIRLYSSYTQLAQHFELQQPEYLNVHTYVFISEQDVCFIVVLIPMILFLLSTNRKLGMEYATSLDILWI